MARNICAVTGTRAEYGLLFWLLKEIQKHAEFNLQLIVTGAHLVPEFGMTVQEIERDGFAVSHRVPIVQPGDDWTAVTKAMARAVDGMTNAVRELQPDLMLIPGDRYEMLAAAQVALVSNTPIAHVFGGDSTEGAFDEAIRHSITKMAHLHFVTTEEAKARVRQLGENPDYIFNYGSPGLDHIQRSALLDRAALENQLGLRLRARNVLVTFHPETLYAGRTQLHELLSALATLPADHLLVFTGANADPGGKAINQMLEEFVAQHENSALILSLGHARYLSALKNFDVVVGNSSSGLYEAPSFKIPTINIGGRQKGRVRAASVIDCACTKNDILAAIRRASSLDCSKVSNPYGDGRSSPRIVQQLIEIKDYRSLIRKKFFSLENK
jgi:UDP-N-acetylglucosamine 2-epimerase (non-hydrolysing)/GDP/UDP-N,N'-diacetylbacillosamine 2-epimerase (hydrolysing)